MVINISTDVALAWEKICSEADSIVKKESMLKDFLDETVFLRPNLAEGLAHLLAAILSSSVMPKEVLEQVFLQVYRDDPMILDAAVSDYQAVISRDPASPELIVPYLYLKGTQSLQAYRAAHYLWQQDRKDLARYLQTVISKVFAVDIHPAAKIGRRILIDHATGLVIGETAVVGNNVSILQGVTLGGTGKETGDRHPKVGDGVMIGAGAKILGNITIGEGAKIGAGSVVLSAVPAHTTVAGIPARPVGVPNEKMPSLGMDQSLETKEPICSAGCGLICTGTE